MSKRLCIFGEVLFDTFPDGQRVLGGAPFNVAWHLQAFGQAPLFISRVGKDTEGSLIRDAMLGWGMDTGALQTDETLPTGKVLVSFQDGEPQYDIVNPAAYDAITAPRDGFSDCHFIYHGSLAVRNDISRQCLGQLKGRQAETVFVDVNLRDPWWDKSVVLELMRQASWVKLNSDEFNLLYATDKPGQNDVSAFVAQYGLQGVILTHGKAGAEVHTADGDQYQVSPGTEVKVVDTVGAGDAFSSVVILGLDNEWPMQTTLERAQDFASVIVTQRGATVTDTGFYQDYLNKWHIGQKAG
jgi:fructokinase